jgi:hypothetical protein
MLRENKDFLANPKTAGKGTEKGWMVGFISLMVGVLIIWLEYIS